MAPAGCPCCAWVLVTTIWCATCFWSLSVCPGAQVNRGVSTPRAKRLAGLASDMSEPLARSRVGARGPLAATAAVAICVANCIGVSVRVVCNEFEMLHGMKDIVAAPKTQMLRDKRELSAMSAGGDLRAAEWMGARGGGTGGTVPRWLRTVHVRGSAHCE
jgi:hypothetical protein